jgi:hypothetical protein
MPIPTAIHARVAGGRRGREGHIDVTVARWRMAAYAGPEPGTTQATATPDTDRCRPTEERTVPTESITTFFGDRRRSVAPPPPLEPELTPEQSALVAESCTKSGVVWVKPSDGVRFQLAWHVWHADAVHLVYGVDEQMLPLLNGAVEVIVRSKDSGAQVVAFLARAEVLPARSPEWEAAAAALSAARLNARDTAEQRERWASGGLISRLTPVRLHRSAPGDDATPSGAVPVPPSPATTTGRQPWHLGGRPARRRGTVTPG